MSVKIIHTKTFISFGQQVFLLYMYESGLKSCQTVIF